MRVPFYFYLVRSVHNLEWINSRSKYSLQLFTLSNSICLKLENEKYRNIENIERNHLSNFNKYVDDRFLRIRESGYLNILRKFISAFYFSEE